MLSHETAKKLKELGYPQGKSMFVMRKTTLGGEFIYPRPPEGLDVFDTSGQVEWEIDYPLLHELIENTKNFRKLQNGISTCIWRADTYPDANYAGDGEVPEEAVANLWINIKLDKHPSYPN